MKGAGVDPSAPYSLRILIMSKEMKVEEVLEEKNSAWYVVGGGEIFSALQGCSVMCLTEEGAENLFAGLKSWHLRETDELIKEIDIGYLLDFYKVCRRMVLVGKETYGSGWEDEDE